METKEDTKSDANSISIINANIARAATSWSKVFPSRKEVNRKTAKTCRAAMSIARNKKITPYDALPEACKINDMDEYDIVSSIEEIDPGTKHVLLKHLSEDIHQLIVQHKIDIGFLNMDKAIESLVWLAVIEYPQEIKDLEIKILDLENKISKMHKQ